MNNPLPVIVTTERYVYEVPSERKPSLKYRGDLMANGGFGRCSCTDFSCRRQPAIDAGAEDHHFLKAMLLELARIEAGTQ